MIQRLTYANVTATLALVVALGAGGAYAAGQIGARDIAENAVRTQHIKAGHVRAADIRGNAVSGRKVADNSLTGADIREGSLTGVDRCPTAAPRRFGRLCYTGATAPLTWAQAADHCAAAWLRLPSVSEARMLFRGAAISGVPDTGAFLWTDAYFFKSLDEYVALVYEGFGHDGDRAHDLVSSPHRTVCVADPSS